MTWWSIERFPLKLKPARVLKYGQNSMLSCPIWRMPQRLGLLVLKSMLKLREKSTWPAQEIYILSNIAADLGISILNKNTWNFEFVSSISFHSTFTCRIAKVRMTAETILHPQRPSKIVKHQVMIHPTDVFTMVNLNSSPVARQFKLKVLITF